MLLLLTITHAAREETITRSSTEMKVITKGDPDGAEEMDLLRRTDNILKAPRRRRADR